LQGFVSNKDSKRGEDKGNLLKAMLYGVFVATFRHRLFLRIAVAILHRSRSKWEGRKRGERKIVLNMQVVSNKDSERGVKGDPWRPCCWKSPWPLLGSACFEETLWR